MSDIAALLKAMYRNQQITLQARLDETRNIIQAQETMAQAYLSGDIFFELDEATGEMVIPRKKQFLDRQSKVSSIPA